MLAMGALIGRGHFSFLPTLIVGSIAASAANFLWYQLGRRRGNRVLDFVCRISLEPDSCVRRTKDSFARYGVRSLLVAKFIPGFSTAAPPLAGLAEPSPWRFLMWDFEGSLLWVGSFLSIGVLFSAGIERAAEWAARLGSSLAFILVLALASYIGWKYYQRRRFIQSMRVARITPGELKRRSDSGEAITIVDLRHPLELAADPAILPGAIRLDPAELENRHEELPRDRELILYCS
jgi:membrane protein DedA with SNARE-associated domain